MRTLFKLHSSIIPVKGYSRSALYDIERNKIYFIPNALYDIINKYNNYNEILSVFSKNKDIIDEYFSFLTENELINFISDKEFNLYKDINFKYVEPTYITHISFILDNLNNKIKDIINFIKRHNILELEIRIIKKIQFNELVEILKQFNKSQIKAIKVYMPFDNNLLNYIDINIKKSNYRLVKIYLYSASENKEYNYGDFDELSIILLKNSLKYETKTIPTAYPYIVNKKLFIESINKNIFYNNKFYIDSNGFISNTISFEYKINYKTTDFNKLKKDEEFTHIWNIIKANITTCNICELRNLCIDARIPNKINNGEYSFDSECGYNPYISLWKGQDNWISIKEWRTRNEN